MKKWMSVLGLVLLGHSVPIFSSDRNVFIGYETLEMTMNEFSNFAGEIGFRVRSDRIIRLSIIEVSLTERHLSSNVEAIAVDGDDVEGYLRGYEIHYDMFFTKAWYVSANVGYYNDRYEHTQLDEALENHTATVGTGIGYRKDNLFDVDGFYLNLDVPIRYYFNNIEKTKLGDTTINEHSIVNNIWLFLGYAF